MFGAKAQATWSRLFLPGAGGNPSRSEPESAPGHWPSGARAAQKSGGSATLPMLLYQFRISFKNSKFIFQNKKLNLYLLAVLRSRHFFGRLQLLMAIVPEPTPNVKKLKKQQKHQKKPKNPKKPTKNTQKKP